ncbi:hypothetical protein B0H12DRAFT_1067869 [Mycena haematopus]|nr:hypothetical protein B0H12DRAFT_1067869 [Mycena haematopus]
MSVTIAFSSKHFLSLIRDFTPFGPRELLQAEVEFLNAGSCSEAECSIDVYQAEKAVRNLNWLACASTLPVKARVTDIARDRPQLFASIESRNNALGLIPIDEFEPLVLTLAARPARRRAKTWSRFPLLLNREDDSRIVCSFPRNHVVINKRTNGRIDGWGVTVSIAAGRYATSVRFGVTI